MNEGRRPGRTFWLVAAPSGLLVLGALAAALFFGNPLPPERLVLSTAAPGSGYAIFADHYRERLAREGIALEIRHSAGSAENLDRLRDPGSGVDAAFTTVGAWRPGDERSLASLGGMFPSPLFVFYRGEETVTRFAQLRGRRLSIGTSGTFLRGAMLRILQASDAMEGTVLVDLTSAEALKALAAGEIDAAMLPSNLENPLVQAALRLPGVRLMSVAQADAIAARNPELRRVVLPRGAISLARDEPPQDVQLLASINSLLVRRELHPALQMLLVDIARELHSAPGVFQRFAEYPAPQAQDLPLSEAAERYYRSGRSFLWRHFGFGVAALMDRLASLMLPMLAALIPVLGYAPAAYRWLNRRRLVRWHEALLDIEDALGREGADLAALAQRLEEADRAVQEIRVARPYLNELHHLRRHVDAVRAKLSEGAGPPPPASRPCGTSPDRPAAP